MKKLVSCLALILSLLAVAPAVAQPSVAASPRWKPPVANLAALPASGNTIGDTRVALDTFVHYTWDGDSWETSASGGGSGTVTSVAIAVPSEWTVSGSPITSSGTITIAEATQAANTVYAGPTTGADAAPGFRSLVSADIPNNAADTTGNAATATTAASASDLTCTDCIGGTEIDESTLGTVPTATALAANPGNCTPGNYPLGVDASGAAESCTPDDTGTDDQTAAEVPYTPAVGGDWTDPDPADVADALDTIAADPRWTDDRDPNAHASSHETGGGDAIAHLAGSVIDSGTVAAARLGTMTGDSGAGGASGAVPAPAAGDAAAGKYLKADGTWATASSGDVVGPSSSTDSALARFDSTTGKLLKNGAVTISDVSGGVVTIASTAGNAIAVANTDPEATTGASVAGGSLTITAGNAVASTDTAGAAAGGDVVLTAGNAARLTSGNANGGNVLISSTTGIGTGHPGGLIFGAKTNGHVGLFESGTTFQIGLGDRSGFTSAQATYYVVSFGTTASASVGTQTLNNITMYNAGRSGTADVLMARNVEANTAGSGAPNVLASLESFRVFTNEGATAANYHTLPTAVAGYVFTFVVQDADGIRVVASTGDTIRIGATASTSGGYCESTTIGDTITLVSINATEWIAISYVGSGFSCSFLLLPVFPSRKRLLELAANDNHRARRAA